MPKRTPTQISKAAEPITVMTIWMNAVYASLNMPPVIV